MLNLDRLYDTKTAPTNPGPTAPHKVLPSCRQKHQDSPLKPPIFGNVSSKQVVSAIEKRNARFQERNSRFYNSIWFLEAVRLPDG